MMGDLFEFEFPPSAAEIEAQERLEEARERLNACRYGTPEYEAAYAACQTAEAAYSAAYYADIRPVLILDRS